jgi:hypothetical protein
VRPPHGSIARQAVRPDSSPEVLGRLIEPAPAQHDGVASQPPVPGAAYQWLAVLRPCQARPSVLPARDGAPMQGDLGDDSRAVPEPSGSAVWRVLAAWRQGCARSQDHCGTASQRGRSGGSEGKAAEASGLCPSPHRRQGAATPEGKPDPLCPAPCARRASRTPPGRFARPCNA